MDGLDDQAIGATEQRRGPLADPERGSNGGQESRRTSPLGERQPRRRDFAEPLPPAGAGVHEIPFASEQLGALRRALIRWAGEHRLASEPTEELVLAVNELATNSIRHGGGAGRLLFWREADALVCEVRDEGHIEDPLIGRSPPAPNQHTGRGLWLVHQLCDLVQIHSSPAGTAVRIHKRAAAEAGARAR